MSIQHSDKTQVITQQIADVIFNAKEMGMSREQVAAAIVLACSSNGVGRRFISEAYEELNI